MMNLNKKKQQKIHTRRIDTALYEGRPDTIIAEGSLQDRRFYDSHLFAGEVRPPDTVHHLILRMERHLPELTILALK